MRSFPSCVGRWDFQHREWKNCPVSLARQFTGKEKKPEIVLEAVSGSELGISACHFCKHGSLNDINLLDSSPIMSNILDGTLLPKSIHSVNNKEYGNLYFLQRDISSLLNICKYHFREKEQEEEGVCIIPRGDAKRRGALLFGACLKVGVARKTFHGYGATTCRKGHAGWHYPPQKVVGASREGYKSDLFKLVETAVKRGFSLNEQGNDTVFC